MGPSLPTVTAGRSCNTRDPPTRLALRAIEGHRCQPTTVTTVPIWPFGSLLIRDSASAFRGAEPGSERHLGQGGSLEDFGVDSRFPESEVLCCALGYPMDVSVKGFP